MVRLARAPRLARARHDEGPRRQAAALDVLFPSLSSAHRLAGNFGKRNIQHLFIKRWPVEFGLEIGRQEVHSGHRHERRIAAIRV